MMELITIENVLDFFKGFFSREIDLCSLERALSKLPQVPENVDHIFSGGVYIRQLNIPAGALIIGKRHRYETCNILMSGKMLLYNDGREPSEIEGPLQFTSAPNVKKMAYCISDCIFMNIHPTDKTDVDEIEKEFIITEDEFLQIQGDQKCLGAQ